MRTTVTLDHDIAKEVQRLRTQDGLGLSEALNAVARRGLARDAVEHEPFRQSTSAMGRPRVALDDIGTALDILEAPDTSG